MIERSAAAGQPALRLLVHTNTNTSTISVSVPYLSSVGKNAGIPAFIPFFSYFGIFYLFGFND